MDHLHVSLHTHWHGFSACLVLPFRRKKHLYCTALKRKEEKERYEVNVMLCLQNVADVKVKYPWPLC